MLTGILIRVQLDGRWQNKDIGDPALPHQYVHKWLNENYAKHGPQFLYNTILTLIGRRV